MMLTPTDSAAPDRTARLIRDICLWLGFLSLLAGYAGMAQSSERHSEHPGTGAFHFVDDQGQRGEPATLLNTDYQVTVSGLVADTRLQQSFENPSREWREGIFVFPLPENAAVYGLTMTAGDRVIVGEIQERQEARRQYEQARQEGRQAARVDQERPNLFSIRLANIPPGKSVTIELQYQQTLSYQAGEFELRLPTTLTPRFMPGKSVADSDRPVAWQHGWARPTTEVPDADKISPMTVLPGELAPGSHRARVNLTLNAGLPIGSVTSPSHRISSVWHGDEVKVTPLSYTIPMDRDLVVRWQPVRGEAPSAAVFHEHWQEEDYLLTLLIPGLESDQHLPRELILVIDTSGSMHGERIRQARAALLRGLETLTEADTFNIIQFNHETESLFRQPRPVTADTLAEARHYVEQLRARGGTVMGPALERSLAIPETGTNERVRQVLFITDGAVGNEAALYQQIRRELGDSRLFTVGIGAAPNMHFLREAARYGRGTYTALTDNNDLAGPLDNLLGKMQSPVLADLQVTWPGVADEQVFPARPGDLFQGEPLVLAAKGAAPRGEVTLSGRLPDGSRWQRSLSLAQAAPATGLHRHWAREKINSLTDRRLDDQNPEATKAAITRLGLQHQLLTRHTSFVAIDRTPVRPRNTPLIQEGVPTLLPQDNAPGMLRYPQTATRSGLLLIIGCAGLLLSLTLLLLQRRELE